MARSNTDLFKTLVRVEGPNATYRPTSNPIILERGHGSLIWDVEGKRYIDLCAGFGALPFGHSPDFLGEILSRVATSPSSSEAPLLTHGFSDVYASRAKVEMLEALLSYLPAPLSEGHAMFSLSGSQAVETALKTAMLATRGHAFLAFEGAYHGQDMGVLPVTAKDDFRAPFTPWLAGALVHRAPFGCAESRLDQALDQLRATPHRLAGVLVEPVQGRRGCQSAPDGWLARLRHWCDQQKVPLIFDEVFTGMGRCGRRLFAAEVHADLVCLGKGLGGGMPLSAVVGTREMMGAWPVCHEESIHTGTFFGHPLSCLVALRTLEESVRARLDERSRDVGRRFLSHLRASLGSHPDIAEIRGSGLMMAVEFRREGVGAIMMERLRARGVLCIVAGERGECLAITPALNIPETLLDEASEILRSCL
jgi:4-aminobutyrate aminotransferase-like enzyme